MAQIITKISFALLLFSSLELELNGATTHAKTVCEHKTLKIQCPIGQVISMNTVFYGRSKGDFATCFQISLTGSKIRKNVLAGTCAANNTLQKVAANCNGKQYCSIIAKNNIFGDPCIGTLKYLRANYDCKEDNRTLYRAVACEHKTVNFACPIGQTIEIKSALYGRYKNDFKLCSRKDLWKKKNFIVRNNCNSTRSHLKVGQLCNSKNNCSIKASNSIFGDPCIGVFKYLEVKYTCKNPILAIKTTTPVKEQEQTTTTIKPIVKTTFAPNFIFKEIPVIVCQHQQAVLKCPYRSVIVVNSVFYGRAEGDGISCTEESLRKIYSTIKQNHCGSLKSTQIIAFNCNKKRICSVPAKHYSFDHHCCSAFKYFTIVYSCLKVNW